MKNRSGISSNSEPAALKNIYLLWSSDAFRFAWRMLSGHISKPRIAANAKSRRIYCGFIVLEECTIMCSNFSLWPQAACLAFHFTFPSRGNLAQSINLPGRTIPAFRNSLFTIALRVPLTNESFLCLFFASVIYFMIARPWSWPKTSIRKMQSSFGVRYWGKLKPMSYNIVRIKQPCESNSGYYMAWAVVRWEGTFVQYYCRACLLIS